MDNKAILQKTKEFALLLNFDELNELCHYLMDIDHELYDEVFDYVNKSTGIILAKDLIHEFHLTTKEKKRELRNILRQLCEEKIIEYDHKKNGVFRKIEKEIEIIDWKNANINPVDIYLPMDLNKKTIIEKKSIIIIAGVSNAGKSGLLLEMAYENISKFNITYCASEWSESALKRRLKTFGGNEDSWEKITFVKRTRNFHDIIDPDGLNIIDFLEVHEEYFKVSGDIMKIHERLNDGIAVIALQKKPGASHAKGGAATAEKAQLYLNIDDGIMTITKLKQPPEGVKNIDGLSCNYHFGNGGRLSKTSGWGNLIIKKKQDGSDLKTISENYWANMDDADDRFFD